jgi:hypothetical protein
VVRLQQPPAAPGCAAPHRRPDPAGHPRPLVHDHRLDPALTFGQNRNQAVRPSGAHGSTTRPGGRTSRHRRGAVEAIGEIAAIIARIDDAQGTIAAAVEEQTATAAEMSRSVAEAATGVDRIAGSVGSVAEATGSTTRAMVEAQVAIDEAARLAAELNTAVGRFRC